MAARKAAGPRTPRAGLSGSTREPVRPAGVVQALAAHRIERALAARSRYKYVHPRVEREGAGWKIVSPNCSRNVDPAGGDIDIAWLAPGPGGGWLLHARDHAQQCWQQRGDEASLPALLAQLCADPDRAFWV